MVDPRLTKSGKAAWAAAERIEILRNPDGTATMRAVLLGGAYCVASGANETVVYRSVAHARTASKRLRPDLEPMEVSGW